MNSDTTFLIFGLGFFLFAAYLCINENRRREFREDYRRDLEYNRMLNERREFGNYIEKPETKRYFKRK